MISIAMTTYNGERFIEEQIESIQNQTIPVDEIIICDDRSSDRTCEIIERMRDNKIHLFRNVENLGYIENFYKAISLTNGDYILLADQDDIWDKDKVRILVDHCKNTGAAAACSNFELIDENGNFLQDKDRLSMDPFLKSVRKDVSVISTFRLAFGNVAQGCTYCFTKKVKDVYIEVHNKEVIHDLQILIIASCVGQVHFLNRKLIKYRIHESNAIGLVEKGNDIRIPKTLSKEPFMYRFFRQINEIVTVKSLPLYKIIYYCRIPFLRAIIRRKILGE